MVARVAREPRNSQFTRFSPKIHSLPPDSWPLHNGTRGRKTPMPPSSFSGRRSNSNYFCGIFMINPPISHISGKTLNVCGHNLFQRNFMKFREFHEISWNSTFLHKNKKSCEFQQKRKKRSPRPTVLGKSAQMLKILRKYIPSGGVDSRRECRNLSKSQEIINSANFDEFC